jgi:hypothetical protein
VADFGPSGFPVPDGGSDCTFERINDGLTIDLTIEPGTEGYRPQDWVRGEPTPVEGLGDQSYFHNDGLAIYMGWTHGDNTVTIFAYAGSETALVDLAKVIDSRLP